MIFTHFAPQRPEGLTMRVASRPLLVVTRTPGPTDALGNMRSLGVSLAAEHTISKGNVSITFQHHPLQPPIANKRDTFAIAV